MERPVACDYGAAEEMGSTRPHASSPSAFRSVTQREERCASTTKTCKHLSHGPVLCPHHCECLRSFQSAIEPRSVFLSPEGARPPDVSAPEASNGCSHRCCLAQGSWRPRHSSRTSTVWESPGSPIPKISSRIISDVVSHKKTSREQEGGTVLPTNTSLSSHASGPQMAVRHLIVSLLCSAM